MSDESQTAVSVAPIGRPTSEYATKKKHTHTTAQPTRQVVAQGYISKKRKLNPQNWFSPFAFCRLLSNSPRPRSGCTRAEGKLKPILYLGGGGRFVSKGGSPNWREQLLRVRCDERAAAAQIQIRSGDSRPNTSRDFVGHRPPLCRDLRMDIAYEGGRKRGATFGYER